MAYFQATGWFMPMEPGPSAPTPGPITSLISGVTDWVTGHAPPPPPPAPSTSSMFTLASGMATPPATAPSAPVAPKAGMSTPVKIALGAGAVGAAYLLYKAVR
jgi:hypothetical protein